MKHILRWLGNIASFLLIIFVALTVVFVLHTQLSDGVPKVMGHQLMIVLSGSMEPKIQTGSVIAIAQAEDADAYHVGDIITYHTAHDANTYITHRIIDVQQDGTGTQYIMQGDNNNAPDSDPVQPEQIIGHYSHFSIPYVGHILHYAQSNQGIVLMLLVPGVLLLLSSFAQIWKYVRDIEQSNLHRKEPLLDAEHNVGWESTEECKETVPLSRTRHKKRRR